MCYETYLTTNEVNEIVFSHLIHQNTNNIIYTLQMDFINENWPALLGIAAVIFAIWGLLKKIIKLAIFAGIAALIFFFIWPIVKSYN